MLITRSDDGYFGLRSCLAGFFASWANSCGECYRNVHRIVDENFWQELADFDFIVEDWDWLLRFHRQSVFRLSRFVATDLQHISARPIELPGADDASHSCWTGHKTIQRFCKSAQL